VQHQADDLSLALHAEVNELYFRRHFTTLLYSGKKKKQFRQIGTLEKLTVYVKNYNSPSPQNRVPVYKLVNF